jgi:preprotein translocase subunit YajC
MCRSTLENSAEAARAASSMNLAVIVLLVPPVLIFGSIFALLYRHLKRQRPATFEDQWT